MLGTMTAATDETDQVPDLMALSLKSLGNQEDTINSNYILE